MDPILLLELLVLIGVANAAPVLTKTLLGERFARPLDGGAGFVDGKPLFGSSKTLRGIVASLLATPIAAVLMGLGWELGAVVAGAAMAGDLLSSFTKRRLGLPPSSMAIGLDQVPESLLPLLAARWLVPVGLIEIAAGTAIFFMGSLVVSRLLFKLKVRDEPY